MVSELRDRELEPVECPAQVGNSSPSGMELIAEFAQAGKTVTRHGVLQMSEKSEPGSDSRLSDVCGEDYPAEQLSSSFQSPATASALINETGKRGVSSRSDQPDLHAALSVPAPPDILLLYWTLVKDGVLPGGYEAQFALLETAILKGAKRALKPVLTTLRPQCGSISAPSKSNRREERNGSLSTNSSWRLWNALQSSRQGGRRSITMVPMPGVMRRRH